MKDLSETYLSSNIVKKILDIGNAISTIRDPDKLLYYILEVAEELTHSDGGSIYLVKGDKLIFKITRCLTFFKRWGEKKTKELFSSFEIPLNKNSIAGYSAITKKILNIANVSEINEETGLHWDSSWDKKYDYNTVAMLVVPIINSESQVIGVIQLINPIDENGNITQYTDLHQSIMRSFASQSAIALENARLINSINIAHEETLFRLGVAAEYRDKETYNHINRMSRYVRVIATHLGWKLDDIHNIYLASQMHDVGKLGIPDAILNKPEKLTAKERKTMEYHTIIGSLILKDSEVPIIKLSRKVAISHHEKWDGTGYPFMLKGKEIPIHGRITAVADVYDALSSKRIYKEAYSDDKVYKIMKEGKGQHFEAELVDILFDSMDEIKTIKEKYIDKEHNNYIFDANNINLFDLLN